MNDILLVNYDDWFLSCCTTNHKEAVEFRKILQYGVERGSHRVSSLANQTNISVRQFRNRDQSTSIRDSLWIINA